MGDILKNAEFFKKLGVDTTHQWILYDERFEKFFNFLAENITDANILTEQQILERDEKIEQGEWLEPLECDLKLHQIKTENPGLLNYQQQDVNALAEEVKAIEKASEEYAVLVEDMDFTKRSIANHLGELEFAGSTMQNRERDLLNECQAQAKQLEELQTEIAQLSSKAIKDFTSQLQVRPLFMHQQPLEQYFVKCDSYMQYFTLFMKENFKIQEEEDFLQPEVDLKNINRELETLQKSIQFYTLAYIKEKAKAKATQALINQLEVDHIHCLRLAEMARETHELELLNCHHLNNTKETLMNDLSVHVQQHTEQLMELVLFENTKLKMARARQSSETNKQLTSIILDALSNAELVWIAIQLDLEKKRNSQDCSERFNQQAQASGQRMQLMRSLNASQEGDIYNQFLQEFAQLMSSAQLGTQLQIRPGEAKSCLYEYEKFGRLMAYALQGMLQKKAYVLAQDQLDELKRVEEILLPFVYNSPLEHLPLLEQVHYLVPTFNVKQQQLRFEEHLRQLRTQHHHNISLMQQNKILSYSKLLWIWFLTEPKRLLYALDEVKKAAAKVPVTSRPGGGLQRK